MGEIVKVHPDLLRSSCLLHGLFDGKVRTVCQAISERRKTMGIISVLCERGDISIVWNEENPESIKNAHEEFKRLKTDGYELYAPGEGGERGKRLQQFDKTLGAIIAAPGVKKPEERGTAKRPKAMAGGPVSSSEM